jgi:hypothetical protein
MVFFSYFNGQFNTSVHLAVGTSQDEDPRYMPFEAAGGTNSFNNPVILINYPKIATTRQEDIPIVAASFDKAEANYFAPEKEFCTAHEFMHILNNDGLVLSALHAASTVASTLPWIAAFSLPISWSSYLVYAASRSFVIQTISHLCMAALSRRLETRADIGAMNHLKTNAGAVAFFQKLEALGVEDYFHPTPKQRLAYCKNWVALSPKKDDS